MPSSAQLQWGRNLTVAEGFVKSMESSEAALLQWGRNLTVAEGFTRADLGNVDRGFNGAAT